MLSLLIAIIFSAMIPILLKYGHRRNVADEVILTFNYLIAFTVSCLMAFIKYSSSASIEKPTQGWLPLILIGIATGLMYYGAFYFYQRSVRDNGVSISIAVGKMGIVLPMILSLILWNEIPTILQWLGIFISLVAIAIININPKELKNSEIHLSLLMFFIIGGLGDFGNKLFETVVGADLSEVFLAIVFLTALLASSIETFRQNRLSTRSVLFGLAVGIPNMLTAYFLIGALAVMNAAIVFPMYSGGAIVLSMIYSVIRFDEQLKSKEKVSILMILTALVLVNL